MGCKALRIGLALFLVGCVLFLAPILLESQTQAQGGSTRYVAPGGDCGEKILPCYDHPQDAVDAANSGDVIKVATDIYTAVSVREGVVQVVYLSKSVTIRGGYTTTNWTTSDPVANPTTLDAEGQGRVLYITGDISPIIEGLHITGGDARLGGGVYVEGAAPILSGNRIEGNTARASGFDAAYGGGLYLKYSGATLTGNRVQSNTVNAMYGGGGGLYLDRSDATLSGNTVQGNTVILQCKGGGLYIKRSTAMLSGNTFISNTADSDGGGLYLDESDAELSGNSVTSNTASIGGGLYLNGSVATLSGNTVTANTAWDDGGGLYLEKSDATLTNTLVADNQAGIVGSGLYVEASSPRLLHTTIARNDGWAGSGVYVTNRGSSYSTVALTNTILVSHTVGITVTVGSTATLEATLWGADNWANTTDWGGTGTIITGTNYWGDPAFVDPEAGDYHIGPGSAAIDAGIVAGVNTDIDHEPRFGTPDLGADEYWAPGALKRIYLPLVVRNR